MEAEEVVDQPRALTLDGAKNAIKAVLRHGAA